MQLGPDTVLIPIDVRRGFDFAPWGRRDNPDTTCLAAFLRGDSGLRPTMACAVSILRRLQRVITHAGRDQRNANANAVTMPACDCIRSEPPTGR